MQSTELLISVRLHGLRAEQRAPACERLVEAARWGCLACQWSSGAGGVVVPLRAGSVVSVQQARRGTHGTPAGADAAPAVRAGLSIRQRRPHDPATPRRAGPRSSLGRAHGCRRCERRVLEGRGLPARAPALRGVRASSGVRCTRGLRGSAGPSRPPPGREADLGSTTGGPRWARATPTDPMRARARRMGPLTRAVRGLR